VQIKSLHLSGCTRTVYVFVLFVFSAILIPKIINYWNLKNIQRKMAA